MSSMLLRDENAFNAFISTPGVHPTPARLTSQTVVPLQASQPSTCPSTAQVTQVALSGCQHTLLTCTGGEESFYPIEVHKNTTKSMLI